LGKRILLSRKGEGLKKGSGKVRGHTADWGKGEYDAGPNGTTTAIMIRRKRKKKNTTMREDREEKSMPGSGRKKRTCDLSDGRFLILHGPRRKAKHQQVTQ